MQIKVFSNLSEIPHEEWNSLVANKNIALSYNFLEILKKAKLNDFTYYYIVFYNDAKLVVGLTLCYTITTDLLIFSSKILSKLLDTIRKVFPRFLKLTILECGTPITISSPPFIFKLDDNTPTNLKLLNQELLKIARKEKSLLILIRDFEIIYNNDVFKEGFQRLGYHWIDGLANTYIDIKWSSNDEYIASMKSYYRSKLLKHLKINEKRKINYKLVEDFAELKDVLCKQWMMVHDNATEMSREVLTPEFYFEFSTKLGNKSKALLFYCEDELIGHALLLDDNGVLRWLYCGKNVSQNDSFYIYLTHKVIVTAISLGFKKLELGLTTYPIKTDLGAYMVPIKFLLLCRIRLINKIIGKLYNLFNKPVGVSEKAVFKED